MALGTSIPFVSDPRKKLLISHAPKRARILTAPRGNTDLPKTGFFRQRGKAVSHARKVGLRGQLGKDPKGIAATRAKLGLGLKARLKARLAADLTKSPAPVRPTQPRISEAEAISRAHLESLRQKGLL